MLSARSSESLSAKLGLNQVEPLKVAAVLAICVIVVCFAGRSIANAVSVGTGSDLALDSVTSAEAAELGADSNPDSSNGKSNLDLAEGEAADVASAAQPSQETSLNTPSIIYVHVVGAVAHPGLQELPEGSRAQEAVLAAGGFTKDAAQESVNLARELSDGEQLVVLTCEEYESGSVQYSSVSMGNSEVASHASSSGVATSSSGLVNINSATVEQLKTLPGIGDVTAGKIVADREANGPFGSVEELTRVAGIGEKKLEALSGLICV